MLGEIGVALSIRIPNAKKFDKTDERDDLSGRSRNSSKRGRAARIAAGRGTWRAAEENRAAARRRGSPPRSAGPGTMT